MIARTRLFALTYLVRVASVLIVAIGGLTFLPGRPAFALGPGEVCVFLEPQGAEIPIAGSLGHIGWSYLVAGTSTWIYGSTENPNGEYQIDAPGFNGAWSASGDYSQMLNAFSAQPNFPATSKQPVPAHPYSKYKCRSTAGSSVGAANKAAADNRTAGYTAVGNNCLDATYRVLAAYGVPDLPWTQTNPYPNNWFNALGDDWQAGSLGETWYTVKAQMALDLDHAKSDNGTAIHQWPGNESEAQWWIRALVPGGYELFSRATGKCVGVSGGSTAQGANVVEWECNGNTDQRWAWQTTGATEGGWPVYRLVNVKSGRCLGISGGSTAQGALAVQWTCNGNPDQSWY